MGTAKWKKTTTIFVAIVLLTAGMPLQARAEEYWPEGPRINSPSAVVMEVNTGTVLYAKDANREYYPASITKIMTALLAIENCRMDETVVFSADAVYKNEGDTSNIARDLNEEMTMEECLYAVMLESANECAYAVAEHVGAKLGGDYGTFIGLMNERAAALGCTNTHFHNANGLPDEEHWVCARDMAMIASEAYRNETFRIITGTKSYTIPPTNRHKDPTYCHNHHKMVYPWKGDQRYLWEYATGGKTGYTNAAKNTLVTFAEKDGMTLVCVVMYTDSPDHYADSRTLLDYCFENFRVMNIADNETRLAHGNLGDTGVLNDNGPFVSLDQGAYIVMPKAAEFSDAAFALVKGAEGDDYLARLNYTYREREVGSAEIVASKAKVESGSFWQPRAEEPAPADEAAGDVRVIEITPEMIMCASLILAAAVLVVYFVKKLYDNFYVMRHRREVRRAQKERFRVREHKRRYRKKDRMFR